MDKEYISVCYVYDLTPCLDLSVFSRSNGFLVHSTPTFLSAINLIQSKKPDLILIEADTDRLQDIGKLLQTLSNSNFSVQPAVFCICQKFPDSETRAQWLKMGLDDWLIHPFLIQEVKEKFKIYGRVGDLLQKEASQEKKINKSLDYLDKFKDEVKKIKAELFEERTSLNSALKQINQMTRERSRLRKEKSAAKSNLDNNIQGFFEILCQLIEIRVEKNRGHGERVAHIVEFIGKQLKFDEKKLDDLRKAAMLHDIGYLFIPEETLQKNEGELTEYEKDLFDQCPMKGAQLLSRCVEFGCAADIIRHLHENSDGSGSPEGLKRRYIPLPARILAGADLFDTLKDKKEVISLEKFLAKLEGFSGSRLDPNIVAWLEKYAVLHMGSDAYQVRGVGIHQLEPGMTLGTAIFTNTGTKLFSVNTLLTPDAIDKIKKYNRAYPVDETVYIRA